MNHSWIASAVWGTQAPSAPGAFWSRIHRGSFCKNSGPPRSLCSVTTAQISLSSPEWKQCLLLGDTREHRGRDQSRPSPSPCGAGSAGEAFLSTIQKAAEVVANAVRPGPESPGTQRPLPRGDAYQPAVTPLASQGGSAAGKPLSRGFLGARGSGESLLGGLASPCQGLGEQRRLRGPRDGTPLVSAATGCGSGRDLTRGRGGRCALGGVREPCCPVLSGPRGGMFCDVPVARALHQHGARSLWSVLVSFSHKACAWRTDATLPASHQLLGVGARVLRPQSRQGFQRVPPFRYGPGTPAQLLLVQLGP